MATIQDVKTFSARQPADLVSAANTWLALLGTAARLFKVSPSIEDQTRKIGVEYRLMLSYWPDGGATIATPWQLELIEAGSLAALETAVKAFLATNSGSFVALEQLYVLDGADNNKLSKYGAVLLYNANRDAYQNYGETAGYVPLPI
jgi:hypothetical protein